MNSDILSKELKEKARQYRRELYQKMKAEYSVKKEQDKAQKKRNEEEAKILRQKENDEKLWETLLTGSQLELKMRNE
ncbi:MAG: hypothetical protein KA436_05790 [Oligoflexales bacterium]|nr:hypothetical protein [Oligoflexales bacterium]